MSIRAADKKMAARIWHECMVDGQVAPERVEFALNLVFEKKPIGWHGVAHELARRWRLEVALHSAHVECANQLEPDSWESLRHWIQKRHPQMREITSELNPALISGVRIKAGCELIDDSVGGRLAAMRRQFQDGTETDWT